MSTVWAATMGFATAPEVASEERELVEACGAGDPEAFRRLVRRYERRVFRLAGRFFRRREEVEDVAQETFLTVWRKLATFRGEGSLEGWVTRICLNTCYARLRKKKLDEVELAAEPAAGRADPTARLEVERLLARLAPADRFVLQLLHGEGWTTAEIAARLGWSRTNVKVRAHRARRKLQKLLEAGAGEAP